MDSPDTPPSHPPPPPPKTQEKPKIQIQIPTPMQAKGPNTASTIHWGMPRYYPHGAQTPGSHISDPHSNPYYNPFLHMYNNKASDFVFKQFGDFKDFTMNTAKGGLSAGEKSAFWFYNKLRVLSKKWFTHMFLTLCLALYSVAGATIFMALEGPTEEKYDKNLTDIRKEIATRIQNVVINNETIVKNSPDFLIFIEKDLEKYENSYQEYTKHVSNSDTRKKTWTFWNAMFYAGTIYTTIVHFCEVNFQAGISLMIRIIKFSGPLVLYACLSRDGDQQLWSSYISVAMSDEDIKTEETLTFQIPIIKTSQLQTAGREISKSPFGKKEEDMADNSEMQSMSIRKRRNLSKNRGINARREKTPEPGRNPIPHEDTTTTDDEEIQPQRTSREIEADNTYEEMKRLVNEQANIKDPVYDISTDEILEARAFEANERRRRSISPFAIPDKEELCRLERKGSFVDPTNKLLTSNYCVSLKDEDTKRRGSLTLDLTEKTESRTSLSPPPNKSVSPKEKEAPFSIPSTPKKLEEMIYPDEISANKLPDTTTKAQITQEINEKKEVKKEQISKPPRKQLETSSAPGELVTKVIQIERTPSRKLTPDQKPIVEVRERIVRTPSKKLTPDVRPTVPKQVPNKTVSEQAIKAPPIKPARSKSASRFGNKTSESEMSEDQQNNRLNGSKRKVVPTPRRFIRNKSPRANRATSISRVEDLKVVDKTGTAMSQTSLEILELMQKARARSLSIPKDDPRIPSAYKAYTKVLETPNKTPTSLRNARGISCPKTIQIISDKEILSGLNSKRTNRKHRDYKKHSRQSSGYVEASQSEYTSSCYSSSASENEYEFDLSVKTAELTRKLRLLSQEVNEHETKCNIVLSSDNEKTEPKSVLRKRSVAKNTIAKVEENVSTFKKNDTPKTDEIKKNKVRSRWTFLANWQQFKDDNRNHYEKLKSLRNRCICNLLILIILCGLGGLLFKTLEGSFENTYKCSTRNVKRDFIENLWRGSHYLREEDWKSMARKKLHEFEDQLHTAHEAGVTSYSGQRSWNFMNSFVYCLTLVTTIGYGHIAPKTTYGRLATIIYAIIGIPLFLIVLADFGKLFTRIIKFFWSFIRRFYYTRSCRRVRRTNPVQEVMKGLNIVYDVVRRPSQIFSEEDFEGSVPTRSPEEDRRESEIPPPLPPKPGVLKEVENDTDRGTPAPSVFEIDDEFNLPISVAITILIIYIIIGAAGYNMWESWSFFESFYFVFISMSTIGLGDLVPDHPMFMMASILYLVFGLALTSMCINVVQVKLSNTFRQATAKLGATIGLKVAEEDGSLIPITPPPIEMPAIHKPIVDVKTEEKKIKEKDTKETDDIKNR